MSIHFKCLCEFIWDLTITVMIIICYRLLFQSGSQPVYIMCALHITESLKVD